ncbi:uncharacterized protein LOC131690147 [Topomyia yanbarensis]|uniref:uncharacterized protein LOC131690147 n=1 Tax=Topomyia yanbarensis TaxID=2498891 RepID=UPI00273B9B7D|nr:uncharacterized protein LOC131690147 [Topomyia yanbarensis]
MKTRKGTVPRKRKPSKGNVKRKATIKSNRNYRTYLIPQSKLESAVKFLESDLEPRQPTGWPCHGNIAIRVSTGRKKDNHVTDTMNVMDVARHCAERGHWSNLMKTVAIMCEDARFYDVHAILRNSLFGIMADPVLNDRSYLEDYMYAYPQCKTPGDIAYVIDKILEVFQGISIRTKRNGDAVSSSTD